MSSFYTHSFIVSMYTEREDDGSSRFFFVGAFYAADFYLSGRMLLIPNCEMCVF